MSNITYSPKDVDISIAGFNIDGWDSITISRNSENTGKNISADGRLGLTKSADQTGACDLEVQQQNSPVNAFFAAIQTAQDRLADVTRFDITVSDKSGGVLCYLNQAFLDMPANQDLSAEAGSRTWMMYVTKVIYVPAPNGTDTPQDVLEAIAAANTIISNTTNS